MTRFAFEDNKSLMIINIIMENRISVINNHALQVGSCKKELCISDIKMGSCSIITWINNENKILLGMIWHKEELSNLERELLVIQFLRNNNSCKTGCLEVNCKMEEKNGA